jgi:hypothetical protein
MTFLEDFEAERKGRKKKREEEEARAEDKRYKEAESKKALAQKKDKELNAWRYQYPSAIVSLQVIGDPVYANLFMGEGKALLYSVINGMKFNKLGQDQNRKVYPDGTIVMAKSVFGKNTIEIDVSKSVLVTGVIAALSCTIVFDTADLVPPMRYPGEVRDGEVVNSDFLKIYYVADVKNCLHCSDIKWAVSTKECVDSLDSSILPVSLSSCWGQVVGSGQDDKGTFILVKFFTESLLFSRTGLSKMNLKGWIEKPDGSEACNAAKDIQVDCCKKDISLRKVEIWWEDFGTCQPFIMSGDTRICKMPTDVPIGGSMGLLAYSTPYYKGRPLYAIPQINGGCIPFKWSVTGPIKLVSTEPVWGIETLFQLLLEPGDCYSSVSIKLEDRCGGVYTVIGEPCCSTTGQLKLLCTSLIMGCGQQQQFTVEGGCPPYVLSVVSGGGTIDSGGLYTAPVFNDHCLQNPTIQVTDCCGNAAQVKLAVNCWNDNQHAYGFVEFELIECRIECRGWDQGACCSIHYWNREWKCDGTILANTGGTNVCDHAFYDCESSCSDYFWPPMAPCKGVDCYTNQYGCVKTQGNCPCNILIDNRNGSMLAGGCCFLNPFTGLPYD